MQRVQSSTAAATKPAYPTTGTPGYFADPDPAHGVPATIPGYGWFNRVQEEIVHVITGAGIALDSADDTQLAAAIAAMITSAAASLEAAAHGTLGSPGQAYSDQTASRSAGTTYTNGSGRPIFVSVTVHGGDGGSSSIYVDSHEIGVAYQLGASCRMQLTAVVPAGSTYAVTVAGGSAVDAWWELRT